MLDTIEGTKCNGIDLALLGNIVDRINGNQSEAIIGFQVTTRWLGGTRTETEVGTVSFGKTIIPRDFAIVSDEPEEIGGTNTAANPQELLMAAFNACISVGYVAGAAMHGIRLDKLEINTSGKLDLRGFLGLSDAVAPGYEKIDYIVDIAGDGSAEQFAAIHAQVMKTSPNYFNLGRPVQLNGQLRVG